MNTQNKLYKIALLFFLLIIGFLIFLLAIFKIVIDDRKLPSLIISEKNRAIRGSIITKDGFHAASSKKLYKISVNTRCIDPNKKELFIKLFSIYSGISEKRVKRALKKKRGNVVLSYKMNPKQANLLRELAKKLYLMDVFKEYEVNGRVIKQGLSITESGESRIYPYKDLLTPVIGYVKKFEDNGYTNIKGVKGIEKFYEEKLRPIQDGLIKGYRDIGNNIILNKDAIIKARIDGYNINLNIPILLQKNIENILDEFKQKLKAKEIIAAVMESRSGKILALASSNRFDPKNIRKKDYESLNASVIEYSFEPGSVMKPITFSLLLENHLVSPYDIVRTYNGRFKLGKKIITDEHKEEWMSAENVIVYSSNIGIAQLAQKLSHIQFYQGLKDFGFSKKTGIDLPYEHTGYIPPLVKFRSEIYKATVGYGYGMRATFMQLLKAYNVFNNNGKEVTPRIANYLSLENGKQFALPFYKPKRVISVATAARMQKILIKVVEKGTGTAAQIDGITVGGKTGTAHIVEHKKYVRSYNSSFFGFANDKKNRYTIGVTVIKPKVHYFAAQTAVPVFKEIVNILIDQGYLVPVTEE
ncbi:peptidoglycan D,D-transpeptidase FtsI family protein [Nitrosophilus kaiyonis]|uniref:peptidoglycan D,D-transpeptidase FtsI family protein n=1 Tax=Nitrosophilus kaiyonis TaxID=2930200 RepID=UPI00248F62BB|nr:penicillin-binding protein 2 [Nitrosophilus kaiyonis]